MKLLDLSPKWIHPNVFVFLCPHCRKNWLTVKTIPMRHKDQFDLYEEEFGEDWNEQVVPSRPDFAWTIKDNSQDFATMTVQPSIDASGAGCWHGFITDGNIVN